MFTIIPRFLRSPDQFFIDIQQGVEVRQRTLALAISSTLFLAIYGFMVGLSHSFLQAVSSAVKMPLLFGATMLFCLPALYFFSLALLGTRLSMMQVTAVVLTGTSVTAFLLLGLSPVTLFFVLTSSNYAFFQLLAVIFVAISGAVGVYYLWRGMVLSEGSFGSTRRMLLGGWAVLYAFVASQMTWRLSPLVGDPGQPFVLLQPSRDNFYVDVINAVQRAFGPSVNSEITTLLLCGLPLMAFIFLVGLTFGRTTRPAPQVRIPAASPIPPAESGS